MPFTNPSGLPRNKACGHKACERIIHFTRYDRFVTKLMSTHGLLKEVDDHKTYRQKDGAWVSFNYVEYLSRHNPQQALG